jgi:hypothetical protein
VAGAGKTTKGDEMKHKRIEHCDDERSIGNSLIITLVSGWRFEDRGEHVRGFDTKREAMAGVKSAKPCNCARCLTI